MGKYITILSNHFKCTTMKLKLNFVLECVILFAFAALFGFAAYNASTVIKISGEISNWEAFFCALFATFVTTLIAIVISITAFGKLLKKS